MLYTPFLALQRRLLAVYLLSEMWICDPLSYTLGYRLIHDNMKQMIPQVFINFFREFLRVLAQISVAQLSSLIHYLLQSILPHPILSVNRLC